MARGKKKPKKVSGHGGYWVLFRGDLPTKTHNPPGSKHIYEFVNGVWIQVDKVDFKWYAWKQQVYEGPDSGRPWTAKTRLTEAEYKNSLEYMASQRPLMTTDDEVERVRKEIAEKEAWLRRVQSVNVPEEIDHTADQPVRFINTDPKVLKAKRLAKEEGDKK